MVKILIDENIPYAMELFSKLGAVKTMPGRHISRTALTEAKALIVRSVTKVNALLLTGSHISFVATASAGTDHIDQDLLQQQGISFSSAPGCNATAVVEYIFSALLVLAERNSFQLRDKIIGIIGVGNIGSLLNARLKAWGNQTLLCDPPRAINGSIGEFWPLEKLVAEADILTFHTPLYKSGPYTSWHLVDENVIAALPDNRILINACRGAVVDNTALLKALNKGKKLKTVLDVWEPEPNISLPLLAQVDIGTPHIAGFTLEGKAHGTKQVFEAYSRYLNKPQHVILSSMLPIAKFSPIQLHGSLDQSTLKKLIHLVYDIRRDDIMLRHSSSVIGGFDYLRKHYLERREWSSLVIKCQASTSAELLYKLGFNVI
ncbi:erythronate-4-phosphate dehydrogenase [Serratia symbiotica str. 'Cinara cedri']|nr:erythronate-4-phosphate dehydrogenase [Serratia symbiotica str. 'Cinara cedri']